MVIKVGRLSYNKNGLRYQFVPVVDKRTAYRLCPWAIKITRVAGGYMAFESLDDGIAASRLAHNM